MLRETKASKKSSIGALLNLNMKIEKRQELINTILAEIQNLNKEIIVNEKRSDALKKNLKKLKAEYARMIVTAQRNQDSYSKLMFIFAASDFNQAYSRLEEFPAVQRLQKKASDRDRTNSNTIDSKFK